MGTTHSPGSPLELVPVRCVAPRSATNTEEHRRLVIPRGENGSVEIAWEEQQTAIDHGTQQQQQRIVICSGPDDAVRKTIVTMRLPPETVVPSKEDSVMVLSHILKQQVLCCLINPHSVILFDIFPDKETPALIPAEGWTIPLPFECKGIFALQDQGLLLHRKEEDDVETSSKLMGGPPNWKNHFQNQVPAPPFATPQPLLPRSSGNTLSLFSFHHPLEEIFPVSAQRFEVQRILWTGEDLMVTLGKHQKCAIYRVNRHAPPAKSQPVYKSIQERYDTTPQQGDAAVLFPVWETTNTVTASDTSLPGQQQHSTVTRDEALADALGVSPTHKTTQQLLHAPFAQHRSSYSPPGGTTADADLTHHSIRTSVHPSPNKTLRPRVQVSLLHSDQEIHTNVTRVFLIQGVDNERVLAIQDDLFLKLFTVGTTTSTVVTPLAKIPSISAQPVASVPSSIDLLVLDPQNQLHLYRAQHFVTKCTISNRSKTKVSATIVGLADATKNRCTIHTRDGDQQQSYRIKLRLSTHTNEQLMTALAAALPVTLILSIRLWLCRGASPRHILTALARRLLLVGSRGAGAAVATPVVQSSASSSSPWEQLLLSQEHPPYNGSSHGDATSQTRVDTSSWDVANASFARLFDALHLLYEERKVAGDEEGAQELLVILVECLTVYDSVHPGTERGMLFLDYYKTKGGNQLVQRIITETVGGVQPSRSDAAEDVVDLSTFSTPPALVSWMEDTANAGSSLNPDNPYTKLDPEQLSDAFPKTRIILKIFRSQDRSQLFLDLLQDGFKSPADIVQGLPPCAALPILCTINEYGATNDTSAIDMHPTWPAETWRLVGRPDLAANVTAPQKTPRNDHSVEEADDETDPDGLKALEQASAMLFPDDNRIREAAKLLCSSRPISLRVDRPIEVSDHDYERLKQKKLSLNVFRSLALPIGRGMLTLGSIQSPKATARLPIPEISVKGKVPPSNGTITLDMNDCPSDFLVWPYFHNGVAAGLRIPAASEMGTDFKVTRTWIRYNRPLPPPPNQEAEGDSSSRILQSHANAGFLLALGLRGNLASLEMSDIYEYLTEGSITTTVGLILGIAANKRGSCDISVSKMISLHIPSLIPQHFSAIDVASAVQTAAVTASGILFHSSSHRMMTEFLLNEIGKRPDTDVSTVDREAYSLACGLALGTVNLCHGNVKGISDRAAGLSDLRIEERLIRYIVGGVDPDEERRKQESNDRFSLRSGAAVGDNERCSTVYEGPEINSVMCAPGSILALGLMYMKTENQSIASALALPETHFLLEFVRPDFLGLRIIARSVILWNEVQPSNDWLESQVPRVVQEARADIRSRTESAAYGADAAAANGSHDYDQTAVRRMYVHVIAGACFGMGLRYAGTANEEAKKTIMGKIVELNSLRELHDPVSAALRPEPPILDTCIGAASISLAMVMAGTGDIEALRLFRILRWRCEPDSRFGIHMIFAMSIGLLFLGGCTCTLGREPEDIAALITAFFPVFPVTAPENHYHLQAVRHLYVLAVKKRLLRAIDVDTNLDVHVPIEVRAASQSLRLEAPALLPYTEEPWKQLVVLTDKYYPLSIDLQKLSGAFFVKRRHKRLEHTSSHGSIQDLATAATDSSLLKAFAEYVSGKSPIASPQSRALIEALSSTDETILLHLKLLYATDRYKAWNLRVMRANTTTQLAGLPAMLSTLQEHLDRQMEALSETDPEMATLLFQDCY